MVLNNSIVSAIITLLEKKCPDFYYLYMGKAFYDFNIEMPRLLLVFNVPCVSIGLGRGSVR